MGFKLSGTFLGSTVHLNPSRLAQGPKSITIMRNKQVPNWIAREVSGMTERRLLRGAFTDTHPQRLQPDCNVIEHDL